MAFWEYALLFLSVLGGGALALPFQNRAQPVMRLLLSFSGAYLLGITVVHLMPGAFSVAGSSPSLWILGGFFVQLLLEQLSRGVEHGHVHIHDKGPKSLAIQVMAGLSLHAFLEGLPLSHYDAFHMAQHGHEHGHYHLLIGIVLHKLPAAFALVSLLLLSHFQKKWVITCLAVFSAMSPLGAFSSSFLVLNQAAVANLLGFVIGSFLHISTTILFEADDSRQHHVSWAKLGVIVLGIALALAADMA
ncbi:MAG: ZIP family metal transporter [Phaeodactylibacter sp.]|nr:ZIP family metal transporter [Phaeodactylibacter sp.]MCB9275905.1 ZIP family metal transporter [Lewinellaceae bacterium]